MQKLNLTNQKFHRLTVLTFSHKYKKEQIWNCICDCGKRLTVQSNNLRSGNTKSCGCLHLAFCNSEKNINLMKNNGKKLKLPNNESATRLTFNVYRKNAEKRNLPFELTYEEFKQLIFKNCIYCNSKPLNIRKFRSSIIKYNGVDRKNNKLGYKTENCVTCCKICNRAKSDMTLEDWNEYLFNLSKFRNGVEN